METPRKELKLEKARTTPRTTNTAYVVESMEKSQDKDLIGRNASILVLVVDLLDRKASRKPLTKSTKWLANGKIEKSSGSLRNTNTMDSKTQNPVLPLVLVL
jgi:hypothetical protein